MNTLTPVENLTATPVICLTLNSVVFAQDEEMKGALQRESLPGEMINPYEEDASAALDMDALAEELNNPLSELWFLAIQNDTTTYTGDFELVD